MKILLRKEFLALSSSGEAKTRTDGHEGLSGERSLVSSHLFFNSVA